jgi:hypothetical protein
VYDARIIILNTYGQRFTFALIEIDHNFKRDHSGIMMRSLGEAGRLQDLADQYHTGERYTIEVKIPDNLELQDRVNSWIDAIANSQLELV